MKIYVEINADAKEADTIAEEVVDYLIHVEGVEVSDYGVTQ